MTPPLKETDYIKAWALFALCATVGGFIAGAWAPTNPGAMATASSAAAIGNEDAGFTGHRLDLQGGRLEWAFLPPRHPDSIHLRERSAYRCGGTRASASSRVS